MLAFSHPRPSGPAPQGRPGGHATAAAPRWQATHRGRPCRAACSAAGRPVGPSEAPLLPTCATDPLLSRIRVSPSRPNRRAQLCSPSLPPLRRTRPPPSLHVLPVLAHLHGRLVNIPTIRRGRPSLQLAIIAPRVADAALLSAGHDRSRLQPRRPRQVNKGESKPH
jgi:hypothetical protein